MLNKKLCPVCWKFSYSAITKGQWVCPTCGTDISRYQTRPLDQADIEAELKGEAIMLISEGEGMLPN